MHKLDGQDEKLTCTNYKSLDHNNKLVNILYNQLNDLQKISFEQLHNGCNQPYCIALLDSRPGTGKSHTMASFALSCNKSILFIVYKQELVNNMKAIPYWDCYTAATFKKRIFKLNSYKNYFSSFKSNTTVYDVIARIFSMTRSMDEELINKYDVFIIDEYTVLNPEILFAYCFMAIVYNKTVIFSGDRCQQNSIERSSQCKGLSNYFFINKLATVKVNLTRSMRCEDTEYNQKLEHFRQITEAVGSGNTRINYYYGYVLYTLFTEIFYKVPKYENACYFAIHHKMLTNHTIKMISQLKGDYRLAEIKSANDTIPHHDTKFFYSLVLIIGKTYMVAYKNHKHLSHGQLVTLIDYKDDYITVSDKNKKYVLKRVAMKAGNVLDTLYEHLNAKFKGPFFQYPIKNCFTSTYHNGQGLTLKDITIDLNISQATCESVYVGLSRIQKSSQLNSIRYDDEKLLSYEYTSKCDDSYYYKIINASEERFVEMKDAKKFENSKVNCKILREALEPVPIEHSSTLIDAAELISKDIEMYRKKFSTFTETNTKENLGHLIM